MPIRLCLSLLVNRLLHRRIPNQPAHIKRQVGVPLPLRPSQLRRKDKGQVIVIFAVSLVALLLFVGLAIDAGVIYVNYGQLKRAVDASAVAAAQEFKRRGGTDYNIMVGRINTAALETVRLHNVDTNPAILDLKVYICNDANGERLASLATEVPQFYALCPDTTTQSPSKLVWVEARQHVSFYFLQLLGFNGVTLRTNSIGEAAPVDLVLVFDISESMASETIGLYTPDDYDPDDNSTGCNPGTAHSNTCQPMLDAKTAAKALVDTMFDGYDRVGIVTFDSVGVVHGIDIKAGDLCDGATSATRTLAEKTACVKNKIDALRVHDDPPAKRLWPDWYNGGSPGRYNLVNPEDRDGDGYDKDPLAPSCVDAPSHPSCCQLITSQSGITHERWDVNRNPYGWGGVPCDKDDLFDAYDWDRNGAFTTNDNDLGIAWQSAHDPDGGGPLRASLSPLSTCTGCGIRVASNLLKSQGRPTALWVMVFLTDGAVNLSDTYGATRPSNPPTRGIWDTQPTSSLIPNTFPNGFCTGGMGTPFWSYACMDRSLTPRYCIDTNSATCPPGTTVHTTTPGYSVYDYAMDMVDSAALLKSTNPQEPAGNNIAIYTIALGNLASPSGAPADMPTGEKLLRYMAAVGDDGDRTTDPCRTTPARTSCGNYYFAPTGPALLPIFESIASRIYTRISQ